MSNTGTNEAERGLNGPKSEEELAELVLTAVSEGDGDELDRLFNTKLSPDEASEDEEDSNKDSTLGDDEVEDEANSDDTAADASNKEDATSRTTEHELTPAEQRLAKLEKELADAKAVAGRTASMQSRLAQLENKINKQAANKQPEIDPEEQELDDRIARLREVDPDTAAILETLKKRYKADKGTSAQGTAYDEDVVRQEYYKVLEVHHDADKIFNHPYWQQWKSLLSPEQRAWAESADSQQVIVAVNEFKKFMAAGPGAAQTTQAVVPPAAVVEDVVDATKVAREKKLQRSAESSDTPVKKNPKFDEQSFFDEAYAKIAKEANIHY